MAKFIFTNHINEFIVLKTETNSIIAATLSLRILHRKTPN